MAVASKTVKIQGSFGVVDASGVSSPNKTIRDLDLAVSQVQTSDPMCIPGSTTDFPVPFGQITSAKRIYLTTDQPVVVKVENIADTGFQWQGTGYFSSGSTGISNLYIASSSVFPTCSQANPTLTIVAMAIRLADHLSTL